MATRYSHCWILFGYLLTKNRTIDSAMAIAFRVESHWEFLSREHELGPLIDVLTYVHQIGNGHNPDVEPDTEFISDPLSQSAEGQEFLCDSLCCYYYRWFLSIEYSD